MTIIPQYILCITHIHEKTIIQNICPFQFNQNLISLKQNV